MFQTILRCMRVPFLVLTPVSVFLGYATASVSALQVSLHDLFLVLLGALFAQISANLFNEYYDFRSGLDAQTRKTPFSGGSGGLMENPQAAQAVRYGAAASLLATLGIGSFFLLSHGLSVLPLGIIGIFIVVSYTQRLSRHPALFLIAPGIGFGPLIVLGTHLVLTGEYSIQAGIVSLVPFFLINNFWLLNQYPDIAADRAVGRRNFPVVFGERKGILLYGNTVMATCGVIVLGVMNGVFPELSIVCLFPMGFAVMIFFGIARHGTALYSLLPYLGINAGVTIVTSVFLGLSILYG